MVRDNSNLKVNDIVFVLTGKEKGKTGRLIRIIKSNNRGVVEKLHLSKKHQKPTQNNRQGGIVEREGSVHLSNLLIYCTQCVKGVRMRHRNENDKKVRVCSKCGQVFDKAA